MAARSLILPVPIALAVLIALAAVLAPSLGSAQADQPITVGVLKFGTVSWQLETLKAHRLDEAAGLSVEVLSLASKNATSVALQAGRADIIVSDWIWVMRQRAAGADFVFVPYSTALGALVGAADSDIDSVKDLAGKRIGVAGGPIDKSWLVLRAWSERELAFDIDHDAEPVYGAPPLLSEQLRRGGLDAVLTFWPYAARLQAQGHKRLIAVSDLLADFGIERPLSLVGYVFRERLARERPAAVRKFFDAVAAANQILSTSDQAWTDLRPIMKAGSEVAFEGLKAGFRAGIPKVLTMDSIADAETLYQLLEERGGDKLLGAGTRFDPTAFWAPQGR